MIQRFFDHNPEPRTIGIVGGLGPYAGYDLMRKIFRWTKASVDQDHLPVMLHSFPGWIPVRPEFLLGKTKENPGEDIGGIMEQLARSGASVIGMPCNTAHSPRILDVALERLHATGLDVQFVSIIESAVKHVSRLCPDGGRIGLMGTVATLQTRLYQDALEKAGLEPVILGEEDCALVQQAISDPGFGVKAFSDPVAIENIKADAGLDIGGTLIGMHLRAVAVPLRLDIKNIGDAILLAARTRAKFIGGARAVYDEELL